MADPLNDAAVRALDELVGAVVTRVLDRAHASIEQYDRDAYRRGYHAGYAAAKRGALARAEGSRVGRPRKATGLAGEAARQPRQPWEPR